jgi:DNA-binding helix-hairpin-helix protein with protein kinase domain
MPKPATKHRTPRLTAADQRVAKRAKIRLAYETTTRSLDDIGAEFGLSKGRISQMAKEDGWVRGQLLDKVRERAEQKVAAKQAQDAHVDAGTEEAVEVQAVLMANTILRQRRDVTRMLTVGHGLLTELETANKVKDAKKRLPLAERADVWRKLSDTMGRAVGLERTVLGITPDTPIDPGKRVAEAIDNGMQGLREAFDKRLGRA